jgi:HEAT repeat protein
LGILKDARAVEPLLSILKTRDGGYYTSYAAVYIEAAQALESIGTPEALEAVRVWRETQV